MSALDDTRHGVSLTVRLSRGDRPSVREGVVADRLVSVLFGTELEAWRRGWDGLPTGAPAREAVVDAADVTRSTAAASTQVVPDRRLAYTVLGQTADGDRVLDTVADRVEGVREGTVDIVIDDLGPFVARNGPDAGVELVDGLVDAVGACANRIEVGCSFDEGGAGIAGPLCARADRVIGAAPEAVAAVERLREADPTTFGYVRRHWAEAQRGIEACDRNYPQSRQVHAALRAPETTPRTLGAALSGLVTLGVLGTWSETVGPTRYDLTAYRPERMWDVGAALQASTSGG